MPLHHGTRSLAQATTVLAALACFACDASDEDERARARARVAQARTPANASAEAKRDEAGEAGEAAEAGEMGEAALDDEEALAAVIEVVEVEVEAEIEAPSSARELAPSSVSPEAATLAWNERGSLGEALSFVELSEGLALAGDAGLHALDIGADAQAQLSLGAPLSVEVPDVPLLGSWPDDLWYATSQPAKDGALDYQLFRLEAQGEDEDESSSAWVAQPYRKRERFVAQAGAVRAGAPGGLLVLEDTRVWRVGSRRPLAKVGQRMGKVVLAALESRSGVLFNISLRTNGVYVQRGCADRACVDRHARRLPHGSEWSFGAQVQRSKETFSVLARVEIEGMEIEHLLHQDPEGWVLESLGAAPKGMWGSAGGGLWLRMKNALWYRSPAGSWHEVNVPGEGALSVAWSEPGDELWIARTSARETQFHAVSASPAQFSIDG